MLLARHTAVGCLCVRLLKEQANGRFARLYCLTRAPEESCRLTKQLDGTLQMTTRRFPKPWTAEAAAGGYLVKDGNDLPLAYVYGRNPTRINASELTFEEARDIAELIACVPELVDLLDQGKTRSRQEQPAFQTNTGTLADLSRNERMLEVGCKSCQRHLFIRPSSLKLPQRTPIAEVASHLNCSQCGAKNTDLHTPIWSRSSDTQYSEQTIATRVLPRSAKDAVTRTPYGFRADKLLKAGALPLLLILAVIAVVVFAGIPKKFANGTVRPAAAANIPADMTPPPISNVVSDACPLSAVNSLIVSKQLQAIKTGPTDSCMQLGVADRLWSNLDKKGRRGLVLAVECAIANNGRHLPCLRLHSQQTGRLFGSTEMGNVTISR